MICISQPNVACSWQAAMFSSTQHAQIPRGIFVHSPQVVQVYNGDCELTCSNLGFMLDPNHRKAPRVSSSGDGPSLAQKHGVEADVQPVRGLLH